MIQVVVTGGRDLHPTPEDALWLRAWLLELGAEVVLHGAGPHRCESLLCRDRSLDLWAGACAHRLGLRVRSFPPRFAEHGDRAFTARNLAMLDQAPVAVLAFPGKRGLALRGSGTGHTVFHARARGIVVHVRGQDDPPGWVAGAEPSR